MREGSSGEKALRAFGVGARWGAVCAVAAVIAGGFAAADRGGLGDRGFLPVEDAKCWQGTFGARPGVVGQVAAMTAFDDGEGPALYVGGSLTVLGGELFDHIAKWDGEEWSAVGGGLDREVSALAVFDDGGGPALYAGGVFTDAAGVVARRIAKWDGNAWSALGSGINGELAIVEAMAVFGDGLGGGPALYAAGLFAGAGGVSARNIAKWDGAQWSAVGGSGATGAVHALVVFDDGGPGGRALYAAGEFDSIGGVAANHIAKWDGTQWSALGAGVDDDVEGLCVFDDGAGTGSALYACGQFMTAGGAPAARVAKWDGAGWSAVGGGIAAPLSKASAIAAYDDGGGSALYVGGTFDGAGGAAVNNIAKWDGAAWSDVAGGMTLAFGGFPTVEVFAEFDDGSGSGPGLYAGGWFISAGGVNGFSVARLDAAGWTGVGKGLGGGVAALKVFDDGLGAPGRPALYAGGNIRGAGGKQVNYIGRWDGEEWSTLNGGTNGEVYAMAIGEIGLRGEGGGEALYAAGEFTMAGGAPANRVAKWDGAAWTPLGTGMDHTVRALAFFDDGSGDGEELYAGGQFMQAGEFAASRIAKWDGTRWTPLGGGMNLSGGSAVVWALAVFDDGQGGGTALYAGGSFTTAGATPASRIAKWNGSAWTGVAGGANLDVAALAVFDDGQGGGPALYAGGIFNLVSGISALRMAKWNGTAWSPVGGGTDDWVVALAVFDDGSGDGPALYAGGRFTIAGSAEANRIAKWNGTSWTALGDGMSDWVTALAVFDDGRGGGPDLYAGGAFIFSPAGDSFLAKWGDCDDTPPRETEFNEADLNRDGVVGAGDLGRLLGAWGTDHTEADITGDGIVNAGDLARLLGAWGAG